MARNGAMPVPVAMNSASLAGFANREESERRGHFDGIAWLHREKMWRKDAFMHQIETKLEAIAIGERSNGIGPRNLLAIECFLERNELAGLELQLLYFGHFEYEMADFGRDVVRFLLVYAFIRYALRWRDRATLRPARDGHRAAQSLQFRCLRWRPRAPAAAGRAADVFPASGNMESR